MPCFKRRLVAAGAFAMGLTSAAGALAVDAQFCKSGDNCVDGLVKNKALVVVEKTHITQKEKHGCEKVEKVIQKNLYKGTTEIHLKLDCRCRYSVKFTTTKGCTGDKQGQISSSEIEEGKTAAYLEKACGSLKVKIRKYIKPLECRPTASASPTSALQPRQRGAGTTGSALRQRRPSSPSSTDRLP